ncbi:MAG: Bor family protein [Aliiglaciecola sp.]|uniref:Bor family protein n=1 Tax=Aliiglaciecola sp. TaxID=1872441 RepID=UPI0032977596
MHLKVLGLFLTTTLLAGCATQTFTINGEGGEVPTYKKSDHFFVNGIGQEKITNAAEICGGAENVIKVETQYSFLNGFLGFITYGIYTPRDVKVYCKAS